MITASNDPPSAMKTATVDMTAHSITGGVQTSPAAGGDAIDFDAQGFPGGTILHVHVLTLNRASDCHFPVLGHRDDRRRGNPAVAKSRW